MRRLRKWQSLCRSEKWILLEAVLLLAGIRLALWTLPFRSVFSPISRLRPAAAQPRASVDAGAVGQLVKQGARWVPGATCLTQSLTVKLLLARRGVPSTICFGGTRHGDTFRAHAWVEANGRVVAGESAPGAFSSFRESSRL
jgi:hypothetical protein